VTTRWVDPRESFGLIGLKNNSNCCYLNSVLQLLFHLPSFRRLVFDVDPIDPQIAVRDNILLNLQLLFAQLQKSKTPPSASGLMVSFGWSPAERCLQQDASEMWLVLVDKLFQILPQPLKPRLAALFRITLRQTVSRDDLNFQSSTTDDESSLRLSIVADGQPPALTMSDALARFLRPTQTAGYTIEGFGHTIVLVRQEFVVLPDVLTINLLRYGVDPTTTETFKLDNPVGFDDVLRVPIGNETVDFVLHGVAIHYGGLGGGHYAVCIRPSQANRWFYISDSQVSATDFAGVQRHGLVNGTFFAYVRADREEEHFRDVDIPAAVEERAATIELESHAVVITTSECLAQHVIDQRFRSGECEIVIDVLRSDTVNELYAKVAEAKQCKVFTLWVCDWQGRPTSLLRPSDVKTKIGRAHV
jgi:ubiquitin carboxyl-terminal hydrolase 7